MENSETKEILEDKLGKVSSEEIIEIRKDKIIKLFKKDSLFSVLVVCAGLSLLFSLLTKAGINYVIAVLQPFVWFVLAVCFSLSSLAVYYNKRNLFPYPLLAFIAYSAVKIRTSNLPGLRDITNGEWTLGPDLDPWLFLRWAKYIVENGSLMVVDTMRYVPLGFETSRELILHSYLIVWFHKIATYFGSTSITQSAVIYPVFVFGLSVVAFFFMCRKIFLNSLGKTKANIVGLVAAFFLSIVPSLIPRTVAGIPEKEASGILFLFLAFYFFISSWEAKNNTPRYIHAFLAGVSTALMGLVWGGYIYIFTTVAIAAFVAFILGKIDKNKAYAYSLWLISSFVILLISTERYSLVNLLTSTTTGPSVFVFALIFFDKILFDTEIKKKIIKGKLARVPRPILSFVLVLVLGVIVISILLGPSFLINKAIALKNLLVAPAVDRINVTVAENRQPYFKEWEGSFGPHIRNFAITFWLFFFGSLSLFYHALKTFKQKDRIIASLGYFVLLIGLIFSRYSPDSKLNGTNILSLLLYALGFLVFLATFGYYYYKYNKSGEEERLKNIEFSFIFASSFFLISLISARSAVRLIMMLVPAVSMTIAYFSVVITSRASKKSSWKFLSLIVAVVVLIALLFSGINFYGSAVGTTQSYVPSVYNQQWQKAMAWVRESTPQNAVFGHWWDYGYWLQSIGERATVLDGGNAIGHWNYFMGRYALTGNDERDALEFLYAHNTTHFLIDSSDIGKYAAFASIGSNDNYDRASFIPSFVMDSRQTQEKKNSSVFVYSGGTGLDEDIIYEQNGTRIFLPSSKAGLALILLEKSPEGEIISQPQGIFVYQGTQYNIPFRYAFDGEFKDFGSGIESGVFLMPRIQQTGSIEEDGALLYLSNRTVKTQFARLYLYNEKGPYFKLVHTEDDYLVSQIKTQIPGFEHDFVNLGGNVNSEGSINRGDVRGPIKIWEISYPRDIEFKRIYLQKSPDES